MSRAMKDSGIAWIGEIPADWEIIKNKYLISSMYSGGTPTASNEAFYADEGVCFVSISDMSTVKYVYNTRRKLTNAGVADKHLEILQNGTILYSIYATIGAIAELAVPATISQAMLAIQLNGLFDKQYYKYNLQAMRESVLFVANGNTQANLNAEIVRNFYFVMPTTLDQSRIAAFLDRRCAEIDRVIAATQRTIEEYKKLKQSIITETVTHGVRGPRKMKDSGVEWIGEIPEEWSVYRIANVYDERNESGNDDLPILLISINTGISDHEVSDDEQTRVFVRIEDRTKYKRVYPGDLAYNMMRAWQGAFGAARVDGMVSPAYVVAKPKGNALIESRYIEALLRSPSAIDEMHRYSKGITDFRLRLYWPEFKNIWVCIPPYVEQVEIADYIDQKSSDVDNLIDSKQQLLTQLESYKKSVIYEYVTGKREVPECQ